MKPLSKEQLLGAIAHFDFKGELSSIEENHNGHINDTFIVSVDKEEGKRERYIVQRVNNDVFKNVEGVMSNIVSVLSYMKDKVVERGGNPEKDVMTLIKTVDGADYYKNEEGDYFRAYLYLEGTTSYNSGDAEIFGKSGYAFGRFQRDLAGFPADKLYEVIPNFHNTEKRYLDLLSSIERSDEARKKAAAKEIEWAKSHNFIAAFLLNKGLPLRVTHNDTKLNNVLFYEDYSSCVIDLDTIMPGYSLFDYGDSIRFGANEAKEDEVNLSKVKLSLGNFAAYTKGYIEGARDSLTKEEIALFPEAAMSLTYECGIRFLTDYLLGDTYFKIAYPEHNLIRAKDQFALVDDMERKLGDMRKIVAPYLK